MNNPGEILCSCGCGSVVHNEALKNLPGLSSLSFRFGTHNSLKKAMLAALSAQPALNRFTSRKDDDLSIALIDGWATVLDVLSFYQERIINEGYLRTATERYSIVELAQHISYRLRPGLAAGGFLTFSMNEAPGAPLSAIIPAGTKVQSVPAQNELPQIFETSAVIEARVAWNAIKLQTRRLHIPVFGDTEIYLQGISTGLQPGDGLLMIGDERLANAMNENWDFRRVKEITTNSTLNYSKVTWERGLGKTINGKQVLPAKKNFKVYALRQKASLFGYNAPDFRAMAESVKDSFNPDSVNQNNANTDWKNFTITGISGKDDTIYLDALYPKIVKNSWLVVMKDGYEEVYQVEDVVESSRKDFTLATKSMKLQLSGENLVEQFNDHVRDVLTFSQSEELIIAETPVDDAIQNLDRLTLAALMPDFTIGKELCISGQRKRLQITETAKNLLFTVEGNSMATRNLSTDESLIILAQPEILANGKYGWTLEDSGGFEGTITANTTDWTMKPANATDDVVSEIHAIKELPKGVDPTVLILEEQLTNYFDPPTVFINANIVAATNGETKQETLGSGNGSAVFQKFQLKRSPLTYVSAATPTGTATTLQIRVNDILWAEVSSFYGAGPKDKFYVTSIEDDGTVNVQFGDGITGSRLPTGTENVRATYRVGIGTAGLLEAAQLSMLMTPQLGVNKVGNPLDTSGASDPEILENARLNAPLTVLTLDRIVSAQDFEDFARAFAGIGKAIAAVLWNGEKQIVHITVAAENGPVDPGSSLYDNLVAAIKSAAHPNITIDVDDYEELIFSVNASIKADEAYVFEDVQQNVISMLTDTFSFANRDFGQSVSPSEVIAAIQSVEGVVYTDLNQLNGMNPFATEHFRLPALVARWSGNTILPAQLLVIDVNNITVSAI